MTAKMLIRFFVLCSSIAIFATGCVSQTGNTLSQVSTIDALLAGVYDGEITLKQLVEMGDTGIGTFDYLDGEMLVLDGKVYQIKADGKVYTPPMDTTTPFAAVINFQAERRLVLDKDIDYPTLKKILNKAAPRRNLFYAFKIKGFFRTIKTRSVPRQKKPFPPLTEVVKKFNHNKKIVVLADDDKEAQVLYKAGAHYVIFPNLTAGHYLGKNIDDDPDLKFLANLKKKDLRIIRSRIK